MKRKFSIIVPIYNSEKYLDNCIKSILAQTYSNFELLLINDGSTDNSRKICDAYEKQDSRIKVFHIKNQGVSHARNYGLQYANGECICFIDSDDTINKKWLENFYRAPSADMIIQGCRIIEKSISRKIVLASSYTKGNERFEVLCKIGTFLNNPWSKCYSTEIIRKNNLSFPEKCSLNEDLIFVLNFLEKSESLSTIKEYDYNYKIENSHLTKKFYNPTDILNWKKQVQKSLLSLCQNNKNCKLYRTMTSNEFSIFTWYIIQFHHRIQYSDRKEIYSFLKDVYKYVNLNRLEKNRFVFFLLPFSFRSLDIAIFILNKFYLLKKSCQK